MEGLTFREMLGINAGKEWDQLYNDKNQYGYNPFKNIFSNVRSFHLMEDDYPKGEVPATAQPDVCLPGDDCKWGRMNNYKSRYKKWGQDFDSVRASMTGIAEFDKTTGKVRLRKFPSKWYSKAQWGGNSAAIEKNAKAYALAFAKLYAPRKEKDRPMIDMLEIGNEPWGDTGIEGYQAIARGVIAAFKEYYGDNPRIRLASAAFQAHAPNHIWKAKDCAYPTGDYVAKALNAEICKDLDEITMHPYSFTAGTATLVEHPEASASEFQHAEDMFSYRKRVGERKLPISATEYGWDSDTVGEATQSAYIIRNSLIMARMGFKKLYIYEGLDNPGLTRGLYNSSGLFTVQGKQRLIDQPKIAYKALLQFMEVLAEKKHHKCLVENAYIYIYVLSDCDGKPTHLVVWRPVKMAKSGTDDMRWVLAKNILRKEKLQLSNRFYKLDGNIQLNRALKLEGTMPAYSTKDYIKDKGKNIEIKASPIPYLYECV